MNTRWSPTWLGTWVTAFWPTLVTRGRGEDWTRAQLRHLMDARVIYLNVLAKDPNGIHRQFEAIERQRRSGSELVPGLHYAQLAECYALVGERDNAESFAHRSIARANAGESIGLSNAYRALALASSRAEPLDESARLRAPMAMIGYLRADRIVGILSISIVGPRRNSPRRAAFTRPIVLVTRGEHKRCRSTT
jgi:hypothetical protein